MKQSKQQSIANPGGERYRPLFQFHPQPMWVYDIETLSFLAVNNAAIARYGYSEEEFLRMTIKEIRPVEDVPKLLRKIANLTDGYTNPETWRHLKKDGTLIHVEISSHTLIFNDRRAELVMAHDVTERVASEETRRETELRFRQIAENIQHVFWMTDPDKNEMLYISPSYEQIWQRRVEDLYRSPRSWMDAIDPADRDSVVHAALTKQRDGSYNEKYRIHRPDGSVRWIRDRAFPIKDERGEVYRVAGIAADITEFVTAKKALQESEARFRTLAQTASAAIFIYREKFSYVNPAAEELSGYTEEEMLRMNFWEIVHPDHREFVRERGQARLRRETVPSRYEFKILRKDGKVRWIDFSAGIFKPNGSTSAIGTAFDITERKQSEERLRLLSTAVKAAANAIIITDREGNIQSVNPAFTTLTGYTAEEALGKNPRALVKSGVHDRDFYKNLWETTLSGKVWRGEMTNCRKDGTLYTEEQTITPLLNERGKVVNFIAIKEDITERKLAEEALRESEKRHRELFRLHPEPQWVYDLETLKFLAVNDAALARYGYTEEEFLLMTIKDIRPEEDVPVLLKNVANVTEGLTNSGPWRHRKKDGTIIFVEISSHTLNFEGRRAELVMANDVTKRKLVEGQLRTSELLYRDLVENSNEVTYLLDRDLVLTYISPVMETRTGFSPSDLLGRRFVDLIHPDDVAGVKRSFREAIIGGTIDPVEFRFVAKSGNTIWARASAVPVMKGGKLESIRGVAIDVTERKLAEDALRTSEERFRTLTETASSAIIIYQGEYLCYTNRSAERLLGYSREELLSKKFWEIIHPDEQENVRRRGMARQRGEGIPPNIEVRLVTKAGEIRWVDFTAAMIQHEGKPAVLGTAFDITGRKKTEEALSEKEYLLSTAQRIARIGSWSVDFATNKTTWSDETYRLYGVSPETFVPSAESLLGLIHPEDRPQLLRSIQAYAQSEDPGTIEFRVPLSNGSIRILEGRGELGFDEQGRPLRINGTVRDITEQKRAQEALRESEDRFRRLAENAQDIIYRYEFAPRRGFTYVGPAATHITGYTPEDHYADPDLGFKLVHPDDIHMFQNATKPGQGSGEPLTLRWIKRDGTVIWTEQKNIQFFDNDGNLIAIEGIARDVTERKRAEDRLRQSEAKYRDVIENATDVIYLTDMNGKFTYANPAGLRVSGYSLDELKELSYLDLVDHRYRKQISILYMRQFLAMKPSTTVDFPYKTKSGEIGWFSQVASLILVDGKPNGFRIIARDITDRKRAEEQLHESEERYRQFFENDLTGDYISTPEGRILECNPAFLKIFGFKSREEALQTNMELLHSHPGARQEFLDRLKKEKFFIYEEGTGRRIDGAPIYVVENVIGSFDKQGELVEIRGYLFDDTKRKQLEQQFYQAQKMESIGTLAGGIAHDFNNILGIILGHASLMNRLMEDPSKLSQSIDAIQKATNRGAALVRQLLTFARKNEAQFQSVRMNDIVREITGLMSETFPKLITVSTNLQNNLPSINGDPTQIHQVLLNLCVNARDAMPDGGNLSISTSIVSGSLVARLFPEAGTVDYLAIETADTGMGIDDATKRRIFEPFFTTKELGKGTGLGLSLVHSIVANHNGFIDVQSTKGVGTTFRLYFPTEKQIPAIEKRTQQSLADIPGGTETILVIDDEEFLRELLTAALTAKGYTVLTAEDGMAGVTLFERHRDRVAVIISDFGLPRLRGDAVLKLVRSIKSDAKFILASGYLEPKIRAEMENNGCRYFLQKPYAAEELLGVMREVIDGKFT